MKNIFKLVALALVLTAVSFGNVMAQGAVKPKASPMAMAKTFVGETYVQIVYSQPHKNNRQVFGELVKYGQVWRLGANEATEITVTGDVTLAGKVLKRGTYSMFAVPQADKWTLIFNSGLGMWGNYSYSDGKDVMRVDVPVSKPEVTWEAFTIQFKKDEASGEIRMNMMWEDAMVSVPVAAAK